MQSALVWSLYEAGQMTGAALIDLMYTLADLIPPVVAVLLSYLTYLRSGQNGKKLTRVERTLGHKEESSAKVKK